MIAKLGEPAIQPLLSHRLCSLHQPQFEPAAILQGRSPYTERRRSFHQAVEARSGDQLQECCSRGAGQPWLPGTCAPWPKTQPLKPVLVSLVKRSPRSASCCCNSGCLTCRSTGNTATAAQWPSPLPASSHHLGAPSGKHVRSCSAQQGCDASCLIQRSKKEVTLEQPGIHQQCSPARLQVAEEGSQARVVFVAPGGPAERAGLAVGDAVQALNGQPVNLARKQCAPTDVRVPVTGAPNVRFQDVACCWACTCPADREEQGFQAGTAICALRSVAPSTDTANFCFGSPSYGHRGCRHLHSRACNIARHVHLKEAVCLQA